MIFIFINIIRSKMSDQNSTCAWIHINGSKKGEQCDKLSIGNFAYCLSHIEETAKINDKSPQKKLLKFIRKKWDEYDHERLLKRININNYKDVPGLELLSSTEDANEYNHLSLTSFMDHQERIINALSSKSIKDLCALMRIIKGAAKMMDCESMVRFRAGGFWLTRNGTPVIFHYR
jgi:hypothetical protein